jgi:hypothetical protein
MLNIGPVEPGDLQWTNSVSYSPIPPQRDCPGRSIGAEGLNDLFEMGTGVALSPLSPGTYFFRS